ncbi:hypothetical protein [Legionella saoudiensis]|uniref:hypothetical protein n=1 Tax=Legionella saoudiensis TaxID=1750561 RepID=UPI00122E55C2|nr:hypothetical protein [Legionella saoudiensis]
MLDERISLDNKKNVLMNFQEGIVVCGDGTLTNIIDAKDDLKAATGLEQTIESAKRKLLQQQILNFIKLKRINIKAGNEIHLVNAFYDLVADSYGVLKRNDNVKTPGAEKYVNELVTYLNSQLTPQVVIRYLTEQMNLDLKFAQETLFKGKEAVEWSADFIVQAEKLIKTFNDRYSPLMTIDMHSIIHAQKKIELIKQLFRNKAITSTQLAVDNQWEILALLIAENAIRSEHLSDKIGSGTNYQKNTVFILIMNNQKDLFLKLLDQQLLKTEHFMAKAGSGIYKGKTALDLLFKAEELDLIKSLLERKAISVLELAEKKEFPALAKLVELQLLTAEDLNEEVRTKRDTKSLLKFLVKHKQFELLHKLAAQGLLTEEHLSRRVEPGKYLEQLLNENQQQSLVKHIRNAAETASAPERMDVDFDFENPPNRPKRKNMGKDLEQAFPGEAPAAKKRRSSAITFFSETPEPDENDSLSNTLPNVNKTGRS